MQRLLSDLPGGGRVHELLQDLMRGLKKPGDTEFAFQAQLAVDHLAASLGHLGRPASTLTVFEFGAGSSLLRPLVFRTLGVPAQWIVDREFLLRPTLVHQAVGYLRRERPAPACAALPQLRSRTSTGLVRELRSELGIDYRAPVDVRRTEIPFGSMDLITSNSTLEHVPREDLEPVVRECLRLLKDDGVICFRIDYEDHYAIHDHGLSPYNFLRFSDREWRRYSPSLHFQNRLRHPDYVELFRRAGLSVLRLERLEPSAEALRSLARLPVAEQFRRYSLEDLGTRKGTFWLGKTV